MGGYSVAESSVAERAVAERSVAESSVAERAVAERSVGLRAVTERSVAEHAVAERSVAESAEASTCRGWGGAVRSCVAFNSLIVNILNMRSGAENMTGLYGLSVDSQNVVCHGIFHYLCP